MSGVSYQRFTFGRRRCFNRPWATVRKALASCFLFSLAAASVYGHAPSLRAEGDPGVVPALPRAKPVTQQAEGYLGAVPALPRAKPVTQQAEGDPDAVPALPRAKPVTHQNASFAPGISGRVQVARLPYDDKLHQRSRNAALTAALPEPVGIRAASSAGATRNIIVKPGDTMMKLMERATVPRNQSIKAIRALSMLHDPRRIVPGQKLTIHYTAGDADLADRGFLLSRVHLATRTDRAVVVERNARGQYKAHWIKTPLKFGITRVVGTIRSSLYLAAQAIQLPPPVLMKLIRIYSWDVDFQRDLRPGDSFEVAWEKFYTPEGAFAHDGSVVFASMTLSDKVRPFYRFSGHYGTGYFDEKGRGARKPLMRTPIDGARLSSGYGRRRHPILGYTLMHRGVDFAARPGTPVLAAGDGLIAYAGRNGAYGKYIRIRHNARYQTAYAHMRAIRRGIRPGRRVRQGQVIGYLGSTGRSTGPHLHYEILVDNRQVNPMRVEMPSQQVLRGKDLIAFQVFRAGLDRQIAGLINGKPTKLSQR